MYLLFSFWLISFHMWHSRFFFKEQQIEWFLSFLIAEKHSFVFIWHGFLLIYLRILSFFQILAIVDSVEMNIAAKRSFQNCFWILLGQCQKVVLWKHNSYIFEKKYKGSTLEMKLSYHYLHMTWHYA